MIDFSFISSRFLFNLNHNYYRMALCMKRLGSLLIVLSFIMLEGRRSFAQEMRSLRFDICFEVSESVINPHFMDNRKVLERLDSIFAEHNPQTPLSIRIEGFTSPEGRYADNLTLSRERAESFRRYVLSRYPSAAKCEIETFGAGENWGLLRELVAADNNTPRQKEILNIMDHIPAEIDVVRKRSRKKSLMDLGKPAWDYMLVRHFPRLRSAVYISVVTASESHFPVEMEEEGIDSETEEELMSDRDTAPFFIEEDILKPELRSGGKPLFAVKSNLLFDVASALNLEIEVPLGKQWSLAAEYVFPWWLWEKEQYCLQVQNVHLEGRYWFGDRNKTSLLTGFFAGIYAGAGYYDVEWGKKGYQGEMFIPAGLSAGFAHRAGRVLRMEYSMGAGYLQSRYREYVPRYGLDDEWHLIRQAGGRFSWFGPTRAKVSLVWLLHTRGSKKGGLE